MTHPLPGRNPAEIRSMPLLSDRTYERIRHEKEVEGACGVAKVPATA